MSKPVIFFSHSSKDKDIILPIKDKINDITGNTVDIFMSSDGQSIPFGTNWIHKVEEGLKDAKIMFVFVTETSLASGWIYFEAGFAYSKGIQVIPVGIGVNIGSLKAPLNLLQGFNITSSDSLNNFISIINKTFLYNFRDGFTEDDFYVIRKVIDEDRECLCNVREFMSDAVFDMFPKLKDSDGYIINYDMELIYNNIVDYLESNNIPYSYCKLPSCDFFITFEGIKLKYHKGNDESDQESFFIDDSFIRCNISLYNLGKSFDLLKKLVSISEYRMKYLKFHFNSKYDCIFSEEDISSIVSENKDFIIDEYDPHSFFFKPSDLNVEIGKEQKAGAKIIQEISYISVHYTEETNIENIAVLFNRLDESGIIYETDFNIC